VSAGKGWLNITSPEDGTLSNSCVSNRLHCVFAVKGREKSIAPDILPKLCAYIGGIAAKLEVQVIAIGAMPDHVHILLALPAKMALAEAMQKIKANSSRWLREQTGEPFSWQEGYGAFSVSITSTPAVVDYIRAQEEHHRKRDFQAEFAAILRQHGIELPVVSS
jgi:putative transposase